MIDLGGCSSPCQQEYNGRRDNWSTVLLVCHPWKTHSDLPRNWPLPRSLSLTPVTFFLCADTKHKSTTHCQSLLWLTKNSLDVHCLLALFTLMSIPCMYFSWLSSIQEESGENGIYVDFFLWNVHHSVCFSSLHKRTWGISVANFIKSWMETMLFCMLRFMPYLALS